MSARLTSQKTAESRVGNRVGLSTLRASELPERTDVRRWRLLADKGRHTWHYLENDDQLKEWPQSIADKYFLGLPTDLPSLPTPQTALDSVKNCLEFFQHLQLSPGNWGCEYGGPMFLLPGLVITWFATETEIASHIAIEMKNYIFSRANPNDGGWGLHIEGESTVFGTTMNYTTLRILGVGAEDPRMIKARGTLHKLGGAIGGPHWAKFWLSILGVCDWEVVNPVPPEFWLLPDWVPFAPWRWWVHMRMVYLPMSFIWSKKWTCKETPLIRELRQELFTEPYESINWAANRNTIAPTDNYYPKKWLLRTANWLLTRIYIPCFRIDSLAKKSEEYAWKLIQMENKNTDFSNLAPVSFPMNLIVAYIQEGPEAHSVERHRDRAADYLWMKNEGMLVNGTNGVQCWDTALLIQSVIESGLAEDEKWRPMLLKALEFLDDQQMRDNVDDQSACYRQQRKGGWAFSNKIQGYAVSDCISEALKAVMLLQRTNGYPTLLEDQRIFDAIDTLLTYQNPSGGCASYEPVRGPAWLELLNAAEVFGRIMIEYDYPECTTAVVTALSTFTKYYPEYRSAEIKSFKDRAVSYIKKAQGKDGSWYGSWGICFTYAGMFALKSLASIGEFYSNSPHSRLGCDFLVSHQREDGGWSESYKSCETATYVEHTDGSQVVMTAWAIIGLLKAEYPDRSILQRGVKFIMNKQQPNGEWLQGAIEGVFNKSCMISYPNYKFIFPIEALGMYSERYGSDLVL
ncbi:BgTH12-07583 [Blumeria graminis f. sp. triticale]|uniref:Terpene cyclase/mutase family member n=3 Tax=Blumeria graminis TaxID=34373 RepID=A0A9X9LA81_BLUGR|nr:Lanosterol synthase [Blumeria graminis f. sp. tritici 96224]CAD6500406.1 BgTH12-07583 [Blumeria graminis f. sp. triticale]VCU40670.1 Bgt-1366 [Blumeria graminis f. sp. tritici]